MTAKEDPIVLLVEISNPAFYGIIIIGRVC